MNAEVSSAWWDGIHTPARPALHDTARADVCVVGLGGSGLAAVRTARALGARVIGVDAHRIAGAAAGRNGGLLLGGLAPFHHDLASRVGAPAAALYRHTLRALDTMRADTPDDTWWHGSLRIAESDQEQDDCERQFARMRADGLPVERYTGAEGRGLLFPADGAMHPVRRALTLAARAETEGATLFEHSEVTQLEPGVVHLDSGGMISARAIVVCADGALARLLPASAALLRPVRLQMLATAPAADIHVPRPVYARYGYDYWQQLPDGRVLLGGGRDHFAAQEYTTDNAPTEALQQWLKQRLRRTVGTQAPITHRWAATVGFTPDDLPVAQSFSDGLWGAGGYCGTGNVVGALCGSGLVRRALGNADDFLDELDALRALPTLTQSADQPPDYSSR